MCIGIPMTLCEDGEHTALCAPRDGAPDSVSLLLVGPQPAGTRVLVHLGSAVRVLEDAEADAIERALQGLEAALNGESFEHLFQDLIDREPELPEHLRPRSEETACPR